VPATDDRDPDDQDDLETTEIEGVEVDDEELSSLDEAEEADEPGDDADEPDDVEVAVAPTDDEDGEASLDELLDKRAAARRAGGLPDEDTDILSLAAEADDPITDTIVTRVDPPKERQEFVCRHCYLVKPRVQLADERRMFCRDCV
jgi:hypothetical protein